MQLNWRTTAMAALPETGSDGRAKRLRWFQYRLRTVLLLVTVVAVLLVAWRAYVEPYRQQRQTVERIKELGGLVDTVEAPTWARRILGSDLQNVVLIDVAN